MYDVCRNSDDDDDDDDDDDAGGGGGGGGDGDGDGDDCEGDDVHDDRDNETKVSFLARFNSPLVQLLKNDNSREPLRCRAPCFCVWCVGTIHLLIIFYGHCLYSVD